jgi:hypothetical protein
MDIVEEQEAIPEIIKDLMIDNNTAHQAIESPLALGLEALEKKITVLLIITIGTTKDGKTTHPPPLTEAVAVETMAIKTIDIRTIIKDLMKEMTVLNTLVIMMIKEEDSKGITAIDPHFNLHLVIEEMKKEAQAEKDSNIHPEIISGKITALKEVDTEMITSVEETIEKRVVTTIIIVVISNTTVPLIPSKEVVLEEVSE